MVITEPENALAALGCARDEPVANFWEAVAQRMPTAAPDMPAVCKNIAAVVAQDYCADTVGELALMMTENQLQKVMTESGGKATWSGMITSFLGPFRSSGAPESAKCVLGSAESAKARVKATALYDTTLIGAQVQDGGRRDHERRDPPGVRALRLLGV